MSGTCCVAVGTDRCKCDQTKRGLPLDLLDRLAAAEARASAAEERLAGLRAAVVGRRALGWDRRSRADSRFGLGGMPPTSTPLSTSAILAEHEATP